MSSAQLTQRSIDRDNLVSLAKSLVANGCQMKISLRDGGSPVDIVSLPGLLVAYDDEGEHGDAMCAFIHACVGAEDQHNFHAIWPMKATAYYGANGEPLTNSVSFVDNRGNVYNLEELIPSVGDLPRDFQDDWLDYHEAWKKRLADEPDYAQALHDMAPSMSGVDHLADVDEL